LSVAMRAGPKKLRWLIVAGLTLCAALAVLDRAGCRPSGRGRTGTVTYVYDADTVEVSGFGKVRLIGVDALDAYNVRKVLSQSRRLGLSEREVIEWSERATQFAREHLLHRRVTLRFGPEPRDDYGRTLAYLYFRGSDGEQEVNFNRLLLANGLAVAYRRFPHPLLQDFIEAEREARNSRLGLWQDARASK